MKLRRAGRALLVALLVSGLARTAMAAEPDPRQTRSARAIDLPLAGLRMMVPLPGDVITDVRSRWDAESAEDVVILTRPGDAPKNYAIEVAGRTGLDCPLDDPFPIEIGGETWIHGSRAPTARGGVLCRTFRDARVIVRITPTPRDLVAADEAALSAHVPILRALLDAVRDRRIIPGPRPPLPPPDDDAAPLDAVLVMPVVGLDVTRPAGDNAYWRVAPPGERDFDALIRALPVFPEVQVAVRRHARAEVADCARLTRHLLNGHWYAAGALPEPGWRGVLRKSIERFEARAQCRPLDDDTLLDVRVAARPAIDMSETAALLDALARAHITHAPPPSALPRAPTRAVLERGVSLAAGLVFPGTVDRAADVSARVADTTAYASLELALGWMARNGLALGASLNAGADGRGEVLGAALEAGVALGLDDELTLVLALELAERREALYANRALSLVLDMRANHHRPETFAWALRVKPIQLASREPAITGLPLVISWRGLFPFGLLIGVDLQWISTPTRASRAWPAEGLSLGLRFGLGALDR